MWNKYATIEDMLMKDVMLQNGVPAEEMTDEQILRSAIVAELGAVNLYEKLAELTTNDKLKEVLLDVAKEEKVHVGEFEAFLRGIDKEEVEAQIEGKKEVEEMVS